MPHLATPPTTHNRRCYLQADLPTNAALAPEHRPPFGDRIRPLPRPPFRPSSATPATPVRCPVLSIIASWKRKSLKSTAMTSRILAKVILTMPSGARSSLSTPDSRRFTKGATCAMEPACTNSGQFLSSSWPSRKTADSLRTSAWASSKGICLHCSCTARSLISTRSFLMMSGRMDSTCANFGKMPPMSRNNFANFSAKASSSARVVAAEGPGGSPAACGGRGPSEITGAATDADEASPEEPSSEGSCAVARTRPWTKVSNPRASSSKKRWR
mmetsp:Transcript_122638/g.392584  ORF Transcript_122638/g.392584 Transcript_122638/m.392584 type:complete len:272 (-) Transcript_122638:152-967(-)